MLKRNLLRSASIVVALGALLAGAATADAAASWHDGVSAESYVFNPCLNITEFGALAQTGYNSDPAATHAGDVFYAHVLFGAATYVGGNCTSTDQAAELDVSPPPGVSLAVSAAHPIYCFYTDASNTGSAAVTVPHPRSQRHSARCSRRATAGSVGHASGTHDRSSVPTRLEPAAERGRRAGTAPTRSTS